MNQLHDGITGFTSQAEPKKTNVPACTDNQPTERPGQPGLNCKACSSIVTWWSCLFGRFILVCGS
jgi:hypothetical protein